MRLVVVSCAPAEAEGLLRRLLEERLVACGNILPAVRSRYWWEGRICEDDEALLLMESSAVLAPALIERIRALHSYQVPKILVLPVETTLPAYAAWLAGVVAAPVG